MESIGVNKYTRFVIFEVYLTIMGAISGLLNIINFMEDMNIFLVIAILLATATVTLPFIGLTKILF